jgi:hypothetical protein
MILRLAVFYLLSVLAGGFSNILAYGLIQMNKVGGRKGWQWIFVSLLTTPSNGSCADWTKIIEGLLTQIIAIGAWFIIIDFPDKAIRKNNFISQSDADFITDRINKDRGDATPDLPQTWGSLSKHFLDWKLYALCVFFWRSSHLRYILANQLIALSCLCLQQCLRKHFKFA